MADLCVELTFICKVMHLGDPKTCVGYQWRFDQITKANPHPSHLVVFRSFPRPALLALSSSFRHDISSGSNVCVWIRQANKRTLLWKLSRISLLACLRVGEKWLVKVSWMQLKRTWFGWKTKVSGEADVEDEWREWDCVNTRLGDERRRFRTSVFFTSLLYSAF